MYIAIAGIGASPLASAQSYYQEYNKNIARLGVQGTAAYVQFIEGVSQPCNELYMMDSSTVQMLYAQLLAALLSKKTIARIDYTVSNGVCNVQLVQINGQ